MSDLVQIEGEGADDTAFFEDILDDDTEPTTTFLEDAMYAASGGPVRVVTKHYPGGQQHDQSRHAGSKFSRGVLSLREELLTPTDGRERLILVDSKGAVLDKVLGTKGEEVEAPQNPRLRDPNENLTTHHNHPWDAPPSQGDMLRLGLEPGLASIYVHSPEASYYVAPKVDRDTLYRAVKTAYGDAHTELMADVIANPPAPDQREAVRRQVHSQTAQTALDRLASEGAIDYQVERFAQKHYPGGQQHDQSRHAGSRAKAPREERGRIVHDGRAYRVFASYGNTASANKRILQEEEEGNPVRRIRHDGRYYVAEMHGIELASKEPYGPAMKTKAEAQKTIDDAMAALPASHRAAVKGVDIYMEGRLPDSISGKNKNWLGVAHLDEGKFSVAGARPVGPLTDTAIHEAGHVVIQGKASTGDVGFELTRRRANSRLSAIYDRRLNEAWDKGLGPDAIPAVTQYATKNSLEFGAEAYEHYVLKPDVLKKMDREAYDVMDDLFAETAQKHYPGGQDHDQSRHAGSKGEAAGRVWEGEQQPKAEGLTKLKTGEIGEQVAMVALQDKLGASFRTVNVGLNNAPIDVVGDHTAVEVKAGLASNGRSAQQWRATIGQPSKAEAAALRRMTREEKRMHNIRKQEAILDRKKGMVKEFSEKLGAPVKPATVGVILSPDGTKGDVFMIPGFHANLQWRNYATDDYYLGTYEVPQ